MQLSKSGFHSSPEDLEGLRDEFAVRHCSVIPHFLSPNLAREVSEELERAEFQVYTTRRPNGTVLDTEMKIAGSNIWVHALHVLLNDQRLFDAIKYVTACPTIASFQGRISRHLPDVNHHSDWHDDRDAQGARLIGLSINLSTKRYVGGQFQIRRKGQTEPLAIVSHAAPGAAHIFTISDSLHHRVTAVCGDSPRTALAGWFRSAPDSWTVIEEQYASTGETGYRMGQAPSRHSTSTEFVNMDAPFQVPPWVISQLIDRKVVLLNMRTRKYYALNGPAAELWGLLSTQHVPRNALTKVEAKHTTDNKGQMERLVVQLNSLGLLEPVTS